MSWSPLVVCKALFSVLVASAVLIGIYLSICAGVEPIVQWTAIRTCKCEKCIMPSDTIADGYLIKEEAVKEAVLGKGHLLEIAKVLLEARGEAIAGTKQRFILDRAIGKIENFISSKIETSSSRSALKSDKQPLVDVCPEVYNGLTKGSRSIGGRDGQPVVLDEQGWEFPRCSSAHPLENVVSFVVNGLSYTKQELADLFNQIRRYYPKLLIVVATKHDLVDQGNIQVISDEFHNEGQAWKTLISKVDTKYTVVLRDVYRFTNYTRIERLVDVAFRHSIPVVGGSSVGINGNWWKNVYQIYMKLYELRYIHGYYLSMDSCLYCEHMTGPFLGRTAYLQKLLNAVKTVDSFLFESMFFNAKKKGTANMVCPDTMFHVDRIVLEKGYGKQHWLPLARTYKFTKISAFEKVFEFTCSEVTIKCPLRRKGMAEAPCCLKQMSVCFEKVNQLANNRSVVLETYCGTLLGVLKMNAVMPWELDSDLHYHKGNISEVSKWNREIESLGCRIVFGSKKMKTTNWVTDFTPFGMMSSINYMRRTGYNTTRVLFGHTWSQAPPSPSLNGRNKYRSEIYRHIPHTMQGGTYEFVKGSFPRCPEPGHHACLDQFYPDGSLYYDMYTDH